MAVMERARPRIFVHDEPVKSFAARVGDAAPPTEPRCVYQPSGRSRPVAIAAAVAVVAGITAAMALVQVSAAPPQEHPLAIVSMELLPPDPPPPPAAPKPAAQQQPAPALVVPPPEVAIPAPPTPLAVTVSDTPPPPIAETAVAGSGTPAPAAPPAATAGPVESDLSSHMLVAVPPRYPEECRRRHEQGTVRLAVLVGTDGGVEDASIASSSGSQRLDKAALSAVRRWRWSPLRRDGAAVMVRGFVTIPFVLRV